jgi:replicative DNA helicase
MVKRHGVRLIVVDYVQIIDCPARDERQAVTRISRALRMLAKDQQVGVLALSQMPRPRDGNLNKRPTKFDLKESGSLEADAHTVVLIYRPVDENNEPTRHDELIIGKQRNGPVTTVPVTYRNEHVRFEPRGFAQ